MTKKPNGGTLSTRGSSDKKIAKDSDITGKMKSLLGLNKVRIHSHANTRMGERKILYYEVLQALSKGKHEPSKDRYSDEYSSWEYSFSGATVDKRQLRIGIAFEKDSKSKERLLVITVIDIGSSKA